jgi:hypothetical protein
MEIITFHYSYKKLLLKWKTMKNSLCNLCNIVEDYSHYFRTCIFFKDFWGKIKELLKKGLIENDITLHHLVFGYSCNNVAPVTNLCLGRATTRSHSSQWSKKKVAVET